VVVEALDDDVRRRLAGAVVVDPVAIADRRLDPLQPGLQDQPGRCALGWGHLEI
jgi:hypothetical protein